MTTTRTAAGGTALGSEARLIDGVPPAIRLVCAYAFTVPFGSSVGIPGLPAPVDNLSSVLGALAAASLVGTYFVNAERRARLPTVAFAWLAFLGWAALSNSWSVDSVETFEGVFILASLILTTVTMMLVRYSDADLALLELALIGSALATGAIAAFQMLTGNLTDTGIGVDRFALLGGDANITAAGLLLPSAAALLAATDSAASRRFRLFGALAFVAGTLAVLLTVSRGGVVALAVVMVIALTRRFGVAAALSLMAAAVLALLVISSPLSERDGGSTGRSSIWTVAVLSCDDYCWNGAGYDTFPHVHERLVLERPELGVLELRYEPHNMWLGTLVELGLIAALLLGVMVLAATATSIVVPTRFGMAASTGIIGVLAANLFVDNIGFKYFWLAIAAATIAGTDRMGVRHGRKVRTS